MLPGQEGYPAPQFTNFWRDVRSGRIYSLKKIRRVMFDYIRSLSILAFCGSLLKGGRSSGCCFSLLPLPVRGLERETSISATFWLPLCQGGCGKDQVRLSTATDTTQHYGLGLHEGSEGLGGRGKTDKITRSCPCFPPANGRHQAWKERFRTLDVMGSGHL